MNWNALVYAVGHKICVTAQQLLVTNLALSWGLLLFVSNMRMLSKTEWSDGSLWENVAG